MTELEMRNSLRMDTMLNSSNQPFEGQGSGGESAIGLILEHMEEQGAIVLHDVPGDGFTLDHVAIHPTGIYVLETRAGITPGRSSTVVNFDGTAITVNDEERTDAPILQARGASAWLQALLQTATGRPVVVRPTLVFPGGCVQSEQALDADILVLNPNALTRFIANARPVLSRQDVMLVAYHLSRHAVTYGRE